MNKVLLLSIGIFIMLDKFALDPFNILLREVETTLLENQLYVSFVLEHNQGNEIQIYKDDELIIKLFPSTQISFYYSFDNLVNHVITVKQKLNNKYYHSKFMCLNLKNIKASNQKYYLASYLQPLDDTTILKDDTYLEFKNLSESINFNSGYDFSLTKLGTFDSNASKLMIEGMINLPFKTFNDKYYNYLKSSYVFLLEIKEWHLKLKEGVYYRFSDYGMQFTSHGKTFYSEDLYLPKNLKDTEFYFFVTLKSYLTSFYFGTTILLDRTLIGNEGKYQFTLSKP